MSRHLWLCVGLLTIGVLAAVAWIAVDQLSAPMRRGIGEAPASLEAQPVQFESPSGATIRGWLCRGIPGQGAVLLLHGVRGDRRDMISRADFLHRAGYTVLLIDLQSHGESSGNRITFGYLESRDASAALEFLNRELPGDRLGVVGESLGAAAFVLAESRPTVSAAVLESMYPTIDQALKNRLQLYLGPLGPRVAPLLKMLLEPRLGITANQLRPIDRIGMIDAPVFIIAGTRDQHTRPQETQAIFDAAAPPKQLWMIPGAGHVNLHDFEKDAYERRILDFFALYLRQPATGR